MSKLRHEISTDKPVTPLTDNRSDTPVWNQYLQKQTEIEGQVPTWFSSPWLYLECYMYRRIQEAVSLSMRLQSLDVFETQKRSSYLLSDGAITTLLMYLMSVVDSCKTASENDLHFLFKEFLQVALWGNRCDLSISAGLGNAQKECILTKLESLFPNILVNDSELAWQRLVKTRSTRGSPGRIDIILDNAGFELMGDLCLAEFLMAGNLASSIHFHAKAMPWFVSDVTQNDFDWTLQTMCATNNLAISRFGAKWKERLKSGIWVLHQDDFWTTPFDYSVMASRSPRLYQNLSESDLIFFKGDLNYRKLVGDLDWNPETSFTTSLRGFSPAPLLALRTIKADVVTGLQPGQDVKIAAKDKDWMIDGKWAVISFSEPKQL
ncbi:damage-control phosphatase ARMT1-like isoform X2 [Gigantopelta aegis]|nr:damage-control phosphatase ARMT1-like isoform X2 [Gigantopelta aegis]XP_041351182.1 damage-control phosphatase ARMT1-like isoform X2 [Gigantopelta aegis]